MPMLHVSARAHEIKCAYACAAGSQPDKDNPTNPYKIYLKAYQLAF